MPVRPAGRPHRPAGGTHRGTGGGTPVGLIRGRPGTGSDRAGHGTNGPCRPGSAGARVGSADPNEVGTMLRTITAGVDGSPESLAAARWAAREAARRGMRLLLLHAVPARPGRTAVATPTDPAPRPAGRHWVPDALEAALAEKYPSLPVALQEVAGRTVPSLLEAAGQSEMLVLGARGSGAAALLPGSVARAAARRSPVPVVLLRAGERESDEHQPDANGNPSTTTPSREVVLGVDATRPDDRVMEFAFDAAARRAAPLHVVHGSAQPPPGPGRSGTRREDGDGRRALDEALAPWAERFPHTDVVTETVVGGPGQHLVETASGACLLVIGRRGHRPEFGAGSVSRTVVNRAGVPVAIVPHG